MLLPGYRFRTAFETRSDLFEQHFGIVHCSR